MERNTARARRRWTAVGLAILFHLAILALFLRNPPAAAIGAGEGQGAMDVALAGLSRGAAPSPVKPAVATAVQSAPPAPAEPIKPRSVLAIVSDILAIPVPDQSVTPTPVVAAPSPVMAQALAQASGASGAACDIGGAIQTALKGDPVAHGAVLMIPPQARTAANAVLLWNGQWIAPLDTRAAPALDTLRAAIQRVIAAAGADCRDREVVGPRFMLIPDGEASTMVVVFGDASWRWSDLLADPAGAKSSSVSARTNNSFRLGEDFMIHSRVRS